MHEIIKTVSPSGALISPRPARQSRNILLTGASGVVGQALLAQLDPSSVVCLVRQPTLMTRGITSLVGDICLPRFGLSRSQIQDLSKRIDCIVHAAAVTDFAKEDDLIFRTNVQGLENVFELAALARVPICHISTAFVRRCQTPAESTHEPYYATSKREGERLVRESGLPYIIIRPSIVIGDSSSGRISRFQGFYSIIGNFLNGTLPMMPASPEAYVDFIPQDVLAQTIVALIEEGRTDEEHWITSGDQSLTIKRVGELVKVFAARLGQSIELPRFVSTDMVDRLIRPVFMSALSPAIRKRFERLLQISSYLCIDEPFTTSLPGLRQRLEIAPFPDLEKAFLLGLEYWAEATGYFRRLSSDVSKA